MASGVPPPPVPALSPLPQAVKVSSPVKETARAAIHRRLIATSFRGSETVMSSPTDNVVKTPINPPFTIPRQGMCG
ncbi:hypothetical protein GCM10009555_082480 [Acrocarpospora macrocephala]